jgi:hypothetical protein
MPTVRFLGKVLPSVIKISLTSIPQVDWPANDIGLKMHFTINVVESDVEVKVDINKFGDVEFVQIYKRAFDLARACDLPPEISTNVTWSSLVN